MAACTGICGLVINVATLIWKPTSEMLETMSNLENNVASLNEEAESLKHIEGDVQTMVEYASSQGLTPIKQVGGWLEKVKKRKTELEKLEQDLQQKMTCLGGFCPNCSIRYKLGKRALRQLESVKGMIESGEKITVVAYPPQQDLKNMMRPSEFRVHDATYHLVRSFINDGYIGLVGIHGMEGVGKTSIMKRIWSDLNGIHFFNVVIWVAIPEAINVLKIRHDIATKLFLPHYENQLQEQQAIFKTLKANKFALMFDHLSERVDLKGLGVPTPTKDNESQVIFTTQSEVVCDEMDAYKIEVKVLTPKEAWDLFRLHVGEEALNSHPDIPGFAAAMSKECRGLPLALTVIGCAMARKKTPEEWENALKILRGLPPPATTGMEVHLLSLLKFAYDSLPNDTLRHCFLYCSLFPEQYSIPIKQLVGYWMGEGFFESQGQTVDEAHKVGHAIITNLKDVSLLEDGDNEEAEVKMQVAIRKMALWIASECGKKKNKILVEGGMKLTKAPEASRWKEAERISLMDNEFIELPVAPASPNLLALMLQWNEKLQKVADKFFHFIPIVRVLDLSHTSLTGLPSGIGRLLELRHLNLSYTKLTSLPIELKNLRKLIYLALRRTCIKTLRAGIIGNFSELQVLDMHYSGCFLNEMEPDTLSIEELERLTDLNDLGISIEYHSTLKLLSESHKSIGRMSYIFMGSCQDLSSLEISSNFGKMARLRELCISDCHFLQEIIHVSESEKSGYSSLERLELTRNNQLEKIDLPKQWLQSIHSLELAFCLARSASWIRLLQNIEELEIHNMQLMDEVINARDEAQEGPMSLPKLRSVKLYSLPNLSYICTSAASFPSLSTLQVYNCPKLKTLPKGMINDMTLRQIIARRWWEKIES